MFSTKQAQITISFDVDERFRSENVQPHMRKSIHIQFFIAAMSTSFTKQNTERWIDKLEFVFNFLTAVERNVDPFHRGDIELIDLKLNRILTTFSRLN